MHHRPLVPLLASALLLAACSSDPKDPDGTSTQNGSSGSGGDTTAGSSGTEATSTAGVAAPAAPTDLTAIILEGGVHLTWKDVADNEDNYVVESKAAGEPDFSLVIELPFDSVTYHDLDVVSGETYTYRVKAVNAGGEGLSNEAMIQVP